MPETSRANFDISCKVLAEQTEVVQNLFAMPRNLAELLATQAQHPKLSSTLEREIHCRRNDGAAEHRAAQAARTPQ